MSLDFYRIYLWIPVTIAGVLNFALVPFFLNLHVLVWASHVLSTMPLGVLAVDVDRLLKNKVRIPTEVPQELPAHGSTPTRRSVSRQRTDCFLIKGDDGTRVWSGIVCPSPPSSGRKQRGGPQRIPPHATPSEQTALSSTVELEEQPSALNSDEPKIAVQWIPSQSFRHTHLLVTPRRQPSNATEQRRVQEEHSGTPLEVMTPIVQTVIAIEKPPSIMLGSQDAKDPAPAAVAGTLQPARAFNGSRPPSSRVSSARVVRLIGHDEAVVSAENVTASHQQSTHVFPEGSSSSTATSPRRRLPLFHPDRKRDQVLPLDQLSSSAQRVVSATLATLKEKVATMVAAQRTNESPNKLRSSLFSTSEVDDRILTPRRAVRVDVMRHAEGHRLRSPGYNIIRQVAASPRQALIVQERERQLAVDEIRRASALTPKSKRLPSTLASFQSGIQAKPPGDPTRPQTFETDYVKPPRTFIASDAQRGAPWFDERSLTQEERAVYYVLTSNR